MLYICQEIAAGIAKWLKISQLEHLCLTAQFISFCLLVSLVFCVLGLFSYLHVSRFLDIPSLKQLYSKLGIILAPDLCKADIESLNTTEKTRHIPLKSLKHISVEAYLRPSSY
jgi:hypothetical protein